MCPPGVDQTERTCQQWTLLTPCLEQRISLPSPGSYLERDRDSPASYLPDTWSFNAFQMLSGADAEQYTPERRTSTLMMAEPSRIESLPPELLIMILEHVPEGQDIVALGLCSSILWMYVLKHIAGAMRDTLSGWAGTPLICTGTYLKDLPPAMQNLIPDYAEQQQLYEQRMRNRQKGMPRLRNNMAPARRYNWNAKSSSKRIPGRKYENRMWMSAFADVCTEGELVKLALERDLKRALRSQKDDQSGSWMLQNFTSREFVMLDVKDDLLQDPEAMVKDAPWLGLDRALLQRICWSRYDASLYGDEDKKKLQERCHRGVWAGHTFGVVREGDICADGWQDVTAVIVREAEAAVKRRREFGPAEDGEDDDDDEEEEEDE